MLINRNISKWGKPAIVIVASAVIALMIATSGATAASTCKKINGQFTLQPVSEACTSPVGICATGVFKGDIKGNSEFTGTGLVPTVDTTSTGVVLLTGDNVIHTAKGDLTTKDAIAFRTVKPGDFAEVDTVIAGTGAWAGATGRFSAAGTFTTAGGQGNYTGEICTGS